jgi:hypothetical protein
MRRTTRGVHARTRQWLPRILGVLIGVVLGAAASGADAPANGLYRTVQDASAPAVRDQQGAVFHLGERQERASATSLRSQDNTDTHFSLGLDIPYDPMLEPHRYLLVMAGTAWSQSGWGPSRQQTSSLWFQIDGEQNATAAARLFGIPVTRFIHPGHRLRVAFTPTRASFAVGDTVTVTLRIVNVGTEPIAFLKGGRNRAERDNQYVFAAWRGGQPIADIGHNGHSGGLAISVILQPGAVFEDVIDLGKWFSLTEPGSYEIHGSYYLAFVKPEPLSYQTIWEDYVGADFRISIE